MAAKRSRRFHSLIKDITKHIASSTDINNLFQIIWGTVASDLGVSGVAVILFDEKNSRFYVGKTGGNNKAKVGQNIASDNPLIVYLKKTHEIIDIQAVKKTIADKNFEPQAKERLKKAISELSKLDAVLAIPSFIKEEIITIFCIGPKTSGKSYTTDELELLATVATEGAVALEKSKLYQEVSEIKNYLKDIIDSSADAIITLDLAGNILSWNQGAQEIFGYPEKEILGKGLPFLNETEVKNLIGRVASGDLIRSFKITSKNKKGGEIQTLLTLSPIRNQKKEIIAVSAIIKDVTEFRRIEYIKNEFLSMISHELRTPLNHICGFSQLLAEEIQGPLNKQQKESVSFIYVQGKRLTELINSLIWFSSVEAGKKLELYKEVVTFDKLIEDSAGSLLPRLKEKNIGVDYSNIQKDILIKVDIRQMERVMTILLENALKFTPSGGSIKIWMEKNDSGVKTTVKDNGIGIARENLNKIFGKFTQVDSSATRSADGIGMGLAMAKAIVEAHGGWIRADSEGLGKGSTFSFELPIE